MTDFCHILSQIIECDGNSSFDVLHRVADMQSMSCSISYILLTYMCTIEQTPLRWLHAYLTQRVELWRDIGCHKASRGGVVLAG